MSKTRRKDPAADKHCGDCDRTLPVSEFNKNRDAEFDGLQFICKNCQRLRGVQYQFERRRQLREAIIAYYGPTCRCCGEAHKEFLALDHMNNDGRKEREGKGFSSSTEMYRDLLRRGFPDGYQILCHNCNSARGYYGHCPHEDEEKMFVPGCVVGADCPLNNLPHLNRSKKDAMYRAFDER